MKKNQLRRLFTGTLAIIMCFFILPVSAFAAGGIYINNSNNYYGEDLTDAYAVGSDDSAQPLPEGDVYAITADGLEIIGKDNEPELPIPGDVVVKPAPLGGAISLKTNIIRVGLYYNYSTTRNTSLPSINISPVNTDGYKFGYFDVNRNFVELGSTATKKLTVMKDKAMTISSVTIGAYHIKLPGAYDSFAKAKEAASKYNNGFPAYYNGAFYAMVGNYQSSAEATTLMKNSGISGEVYSGSSKSICITETGTKQIVFEYDGGATSSLAIRPYANSGKVNTQLGARKYFGDFQFLRLKGDDMTVVNFIDIEDYTKGVLPHEMSTSWPLEALKAQALAARTYALNNLNTYNNYGFDVTNDTYSQVYRGNGDAAASTDKAVDETAGQYITYNGKLISALYFSSDGGATEDNVNVNGNTSHPYLKGVFDPFEQAANSINSRHSWTKTYTPKQLGDRVGLGEIATATQTFSATGNCIRIDFVDKAGKKAFFQRTECRTKMGLNSIRYTLEKDSSGNFVANGSGWGHNVGMSQFGAYAMAKYYNYTYNYILGFY
ncbi:SpoIID/LytB domain-containing protein, partial [Clostridiaceae bacterium OttesenSCG-928-D20]|nr:SpoIID/LytB domain-containing protein [Clostridiaceae bacterium OttesenSCG-928-D20]